jgi:hypothetical protein
VGRWESLGSWSLLLAAATCTRRAVLRPHTHQARAKMAGVRLWGLRVEGRGERDEGRKNVCGLDSRVGWIRFDGGLGGSGPKKGRVGYCGLFLSVD